MFLRIATWITGDDYSTLKSYDVTSRKKVINTALQMLIPVSIWAFVGFGMVTTILGQELYVGIVTGFVLGLFIFIVDRTIIQGFSNGLGTGVRLIFTLLSGALGAVVFDSIIFEEDVNTKIAQEQQLTVDSMAMASTMGSEMYATLENQNTLVQQKYADYITAEQEFMDEIDGDGGSGNSGYGPIAQHKESIMNQKKEEWQDAEATLQEAEKSFNATVDNKRNEILANDGSHAFFHRFMVLKDIILDDVWALTLWLVFFGCTLLLESFVVLSKMTSKKTNYELDLETYDLIKNRQRGIRPKQVGFWASLRAFLMKLFGIKAA